MAYCIHQCNAGTGNRGSPRAAVRLNHIAVNINRVFAELFQVHRGAQRASNQALNLLGAATLLTARRLSPHPTIRRAGQHAVLCSDPTLALTSQESRYTGLDASGTYNFGIAKFNQYRSLGMAGEITGNFYRPQLLGATPTGTIHIMLPLKKTHYITSPMQIAASSGKLFSARC